MAAYARRPEPEDPVAVRVQPTGHSTNVHEETFNVYSIEDVGFRIRCLLCFEPMEERSDPLYLSFIPTLTRDVLKKRAKCRETGQLCAVGIRDCEVDGTTRGVGGGMGKDKQRGWTVWLKVGPVPRHTARLKFRPFILRTLDRSTRSGPSLSHTLCENTGPSSSLKKNRTHRQRYKSANTN